MNIMMEFDVCLLHGLYIQDLWLYHLAVHAQFSSVMVIDFSPVDHLIGIGMLAKITVYMAFCGSNVVPPHAKPRITLNVAGKSTQKKFLKFF